jgi:polysaccharide deacetylase family protein (PEP-CTERM system associated)
VTAVQPSRTFLFSIDLEDIRTFVPNGDRYAERVPQNVERWLAFLARHRVRCTFFTVGDVARRHPATVERILADGHELACHGNDHEPLNRLDPDGLRRTLEQNRRELEKLGARDVVGYRAPTMSLTADTRWAHGVLAELGFTYSSSVIPAKNPLYGWPGFGEACVKVDERVWEIPVSLTNLPALKVPFAAGTYFRALPFPLVRRLFRARLAARRPVVGYFHPWDIDTEQERFGFPELNGFYTWLVYYNRQRVLPRLDRLFREPVEVVPYAEFVARRLDAPRSAA